MATASSLGRLGCDKGKGHPGNVVAAEVRAPVIKTVDAYLEGAKKRSLHYGHLSAKEKDKALRAHFSKSIHDGTQ